MCQVSILVAVYNSAKYIRRCIDSLLGQTLKDIQIICIDDCSTDASLKILNEYAAIDQRIKVISLKENQGQAHARNEGLKQATGRYITFVDSDDWLSIDALQQSVDVFMKDVHTDTVLFDVVIYNSTTTEEKIYVMPPFCQMTGKEAFTASLTWKIHGCYITKADIHKRFPYDETCRTYSDDNTTRLHYLNSRKVGRCKGKYYYFQNPESTTHIISVRRFDHIRANESMRNQLLKLNIESNILNLYEKTRWLVLVDTYMFYFYNRHKLTKTECIYGLKNMHHIWKSIDTKELPRSLKYKFGYIPFKYSWNLFRIQEEIYFLLKSLFALKK